MNTVKEFLETQADFSRTPGIQYAFFSQTEILFQFKKGYANVSGRQEIGSSHTVNAYSVTKTFTALGILQLVMKGKIKLEDSYKRYLPGLPYPDEISIYQLLTHTAGIPNPLPLNWIHLVSEHQTFNRNAFFDHIFEKHSKPTFKPGKKFRYSNLGYVMLGNLIEKVSGMTYEEYIDQNIFQHLLLQPGDLGFVHPDTPRHAKGYQRNFSFMNFLLGFFINKSKFTEAAVEGWLPFRYFYVNGTSYGGLVANLNGLIKYVQAFLQPGTPFLSDELASILFSETITSDGKKTGMCCSWFASALNGIKYFCHAGGGGGYYCEIRIYPEIKRGSVIMFNRSGMSDERFLDKADKFFMPGI
jgi:D-alanyl-D-alanine carboxypeptidase